MFHLGRTLYSLLGLKMGVFIFSPLKRGRNPPHPHVGHSVTDSVPGWKILWHSPPRRGKWWGFENGAYIYTLKNVARVLLVSYYLLVFHYVFFCHLLKFVEPAVLYNCIMGHWLSWSLTMSTMLLWFQRNSINFYRKIYLWLDIIKLHTWDKIINNALK